MAAVKPQVFTRPVRTSGLAAAHTSGLMWSHCWCLLSPYYYSVVRWLCPGFTLSSAFGFPKNSVVLTFLSWIFLSRWPPELLAVRVWKCRAVAAALSGHPLSPPSSSEILSALLSPPFEPAPPRALPAPAEEGVEVLLQRFAFCSVELPSFPVPLTTETTAVCSRAALSVPALALAG